jgi:outer membrane protein assembly factor BamA
LIPTYARVISDTESESVVFQDGPEGENLIGRASNFASWFYRFGLSGCPPQYCRRFSVWQFGMSLALFADAGTTWFRKDGLRVKDFLSGYGAGIRFLLPYGIVARTEYALNNHGKGQFILDFRTPF